MLRSEGFIFRNNFRFFLEKGEVIVWQRHWDRDVLISRAPREEFVSGRILKPGNDYSDWDIDKFQKVYPDRNFEEFIQETGLANQSGLYLPIYEMKVLKEFTFLYLEKEKEAIEIFFEKERFSFDYSGKNN